MDCCSKKMTKEEATAHGEKLLAKMKGKWWKLRVHENLGWHYCVFNGALSIHQSNDGRYGALLSNIDEGRYCGGGLAVWNDGKYYIDPNRAVLNQLAKAKAHVEQLLDVVDAVSKRVAS